MYNKWIIFTSIDLALLVPFATNTSNMSIEEANPHRKHWVHLCKKSNSGLWFRYRSTVSPVGVYVATSFAASLKCKFILCVTKNVQPCTCTD